MPNSKTPSVRIVAGFLCLLLAGFFVGIAWQPVYTAFASTIFFPSYSTVQNGGVSVTQRTKLNFVNGGCVDNAGTFATDCTISSNASAGLITFSGDAIDLSGGTAPVFVPLGGGSLGSATETAVQTKVQPITTFSNACVKVSAAPGGADSITVTLRKGAANQAITMTITGAATNACDSTHTFTNAAGDVMDWAIVPSGVIAAYTPNVTISVQVGSLTSGTVASSTAFNIAQYASNGNVVSGVAVPDCDDTAGQHLNRDATTGVWVCGTSGSGGASITIGAIASLPAMGTTVGDTYYTSDGLYIFVWDGAVWQAFYGSIPVTPPVAADFSGVNIISATTSSANGGLTLTGPNVGGINIQAQVASLPAMAPWTVDLLLSEFTVGGGANFNGGIILRESGTGKLETFGSNASVGATTLSITRWTDPTTFASAAVNTTVGLPFFSAGWWARVQNDSTNLIYSICSTKATCVQFFSEPLTTHFTAAPDQIGIYFDSETTGNVPQMVTLIHISGL